jgi:hypothetical protein
LEHPYAIPDALGFEKEGKLSQFAVASIWIGGGRSSCGEASAALGSRDTRIKFSSLWWIEEEGAHSVSFLWMWQQSLEIEPGTCAIR